MTLENHPTNIFLIDDQPIDNVIFKMLINKVVDNTKVSANVDGQIAIEQLVGLTKTSPESLPDYIFLDINMPGMDGWQFLSEYERLSINSFKKIRIYMLSSTVYRHDIDRSKANPLVVDFLEKPINLERIKSVFSAS